MNPYPRLCRETQEKAEAAARDRARKAFRTMLFWVGMAVFGAVALCVGLAARGESSGAMRIEEDRVSFVEINSVYSDEGHCTLQQVCFATWFDFNLDDPRFLYQAWRLLKCPNMVPMRDYQRGGYVAIWMDGDQLRVVRCDTVLFTFTDHDVELRQRSIHPQDARRELFRR